MQQNSHLALGACGACSLPITFHIEDGLGRNGTLSETKGALDHYWIILSEWPVRSSSIAPEHTPPAVAKRFIEGEEAYNRGSWNASVAMYRSALDIATKGLEGVPSGQSFFHRLKWLHENHRITPDMKAWADHVRIEGNEALHDPEEFTQADAKPLRLFTEMFLRYVFELPGEVAAFRNESVEEGDANA